MRQPRRSSHLTTLLLVASWVLVAGPLAGWATPAHAQPENEISLRPVEDPLYGISSVAPEGWTAQGQGVHARGMPPTDPALLALQSAPTGIEAFWSSLLTQLGRDEVPDATGSHPTQAFEWTLYDVEVPSPGGTLSLSLALAEREGSTYLVALQSDSQEADLLREEVFLPAVDAFRLHDPEPDADSASLPYDAIEVSFPGGAPEVTLAGTLTLPRSAGPHPVVVLLSGSGPQDRDESLAPITALKPFALIADALTRAGVAILRYDDRGVGRSTGNADAATVDDLTADARAAIDFLHGREEADPARIGVLGHSEGGLYAARLAATDPRVAVVVGLAASAVQGVPLLIAQYEAITRAAGASEVEVAATRAFAEDVLPFALAGDESGVASAVAEHYGAYWDRQPAATQEVFGERDAFIEQEIANQARMLLSPWFRSVLASDPAADWAHVRVPALAIFGGLDTQVPADQNEPAWREALAANPDATAIVLPAANHLFQTATTGSPAEYGRLEPAFAPDLLPALTAWLTERLLS